MILECRDLLIGFDMPLTPPINLNLDLNQSVAILGRSGTGKTTFLNTILGIQKPLGGGVVVSGCNVSKMRYSELAALRRDSIGVIFQHGELMPTYTSLDNVLLPRLLGNDSDPGAADDAIELLEELRVPIDRRAEDLSGGERQRVGLARALINRPGLLLADEPTGSLDPQTRGEVLDILFSDLVRERCALVVITHDPVVADRADSQFALGPATSRVSLEN